MTQFLAEFSGSRLTFWSDSESHAVEVIAMWSLALRGETEAPRTWAELNAALSRKGVRYSIRALPVRATA